MPLSEKEKLLGRKKYYESALVLLKKAISAQAEEWQSSRGACIKPSTIYDGEPIGTISIAGECMAEILSIAEAKTSELLQKTEELLGRIDNGTC